MLFDTLKIAEKPVKTKTGAVFHQRRRAQQNSSTSTRSCAASPDYRELVKLKNTYVDVLPQLIHPDTYRIHTSFNQVVAVTAAWSSDNPNLWNIPIRTERGREIESVCACGKDYTLLLTIRRSSSASSRN